MKLEGGKFLPPWKSVSLECHRDLLSPVRAGRFSVVTVLSTRVTVTLGRVLCPASDLSFAHSTQQINAPRKEDGI